MKKLSVGKKTFLVSAAFCFAWFLIKNQALAYSVTVRLPGAPETISDPGKYIESLFLFGLTLAGFLAVAAMVVGGIMYMTGGTIGRVEKAKEIMGGAITGIILLLCAYLLLATIDPSLTKLSPLRLKPVGIDAPAQQPATPTSGVVTTQTTIRVYFDATSEAYNTREKCEAIGRDTYGERFIGVMFDNINCIIVARRIQ